ncbi:hypothetical protein [Methanospirillum hungatei]|uniref:hypothetical protein n=1 Tax=Methanospirillum hungatei TaxID=2203 RepID=UPI0026F1F78B|nr:hypothetical protein [Methanospirillum hungatei]MCA1917660.1 hypothetical protein [Methanospirillum hungatei]
MTTLPHSIQGFNITHLDKDWKLATVYAAYLSPKTPQQALKLIYHGATTGVSENWVINTRRKLNEMGYIIKVTDENSNTLYKSDIEPLVNLILSHQKDQFFKENGADKIIKSLYIFLNSQWFRDFFKEEYFYSPIRHSDMTVYGPYANLYIKTPSGLNQKLEITNLSQRLSHLLYDIGYYSHNIRWDTISRFREDHNIDESDMKLGEEMILLGDFELFIKHNKMNVPSNLLIQICSIIKFLAKKEYCGKAPLQLFQKLFQSGVCCFIPTNISLMFRLMPRLPDTPEFLDFGFIRKMMHSQSYKIDPKCITHYLSGAQLGKDNL